MRLLLATGHGGAGLFHDDQHLPAAFSKHGIDARPQDWKSIAPDETPVLIRTPWDYAQHADRFAAWFDDLDAAGTLVLNPTSVLRWNMDKRYLLELEEAGHAIVPTRIAPRLEDARDVAALAGWSDTVVKPVVGGGAEGLHRLRHGQLQPLAATGNPWGAANASGACLVQPFLPEIEAGEWSLFFFGGTYSHAILKRPAAGDIRVQEEHGGRTIQAKPTDAMLVAAAAIAAEVPDAVYARVDGVVVDDEFLLMELELIEPELYFRHTTGGEDRFAAAIATVLRA